MLGIRIVTAAVLVPLTLAALFLLGPRGWGVVSLVVVALAAIEWADLAGYPQRAWLPFAAGTFLTGFGLLFLRASGFEPLSGWPDAVSLAVCGFATLFWVLIAPAWLAGNWRVDSKIALALVGWLVLIATWVAVVQLQARSPWMLLALMAVVWIADTAAYFAGRAFGARRLGAGGGGGETSAGGLGRAL